jgi:UDP-glucose 4-epimerase
MKNQVLVTGGTGYIGSHTVVELQNSGYEVIIIDDLSNSTAKVVDNIQQITGIRPVFEKFDLCDNHKLKSFFQRYNRIKAIIHFAAYKAVGESVDKPLEYYRNNLISMMNLLEAMKTFNISSLVFSSSCTVYGQPDKLPVTEASPILKANSPYGNTKQICEEIIQDFIMPNKDIKAISLRYFNPIGAHETSLIGELPLGVPNNLVPFITQTAIGLRDYLRVFGNNYDTHDGYGIRDYIHVVDLAKAHVVAIERLLKNKNKTTYEFFNVGTGKGYSVLEVISAFEKVSGEKMIYKVVDRRPGDISQIWADTSLANRELGWKSEKSLEEALLSAWNWEKKLRK